MPLTSALALLAECGNPFALVTDLASADGSNCRVDRSLDRRELFTRHRMANFANDGSTHGVVIDADEDACARMLPAGRLTTRSRSTSHS